MCSQSDLGCSVLPFHRPKSNSAAIGGGVAAAILVLIGLLIALLVYRRRRRSQAVQLLDTPASPSDHAPMAEKGFATVFVDQEADDGPPTPRQVSSSTLPTFQSQLSVPSFASTAAAVDEHGQSASYRKPAPNYTPSIPSVHTLSIHSTGTRSSYFADPFADITEPRGSQSESDNPFADSAAVTVARTSSVSSVGSSASTGTSMYAPSSSADPRQSLRSIGTTGTSMYATEVCSSCFIIILRTPS